ncbi:MAG: hypothetical protein PHI05_04010 [Bacilli bacterium]|nr:hypothetical protein [Bacilli bacterium]MDD4547885.1 hypothetical protein [Bacilli bacterium]
MNCVCLEDDICELEIDEQIIEKLKQNNIYIVDELWELKENDLKKFGINMSEINHVRIKLQLQSLDLNKKVYKKN